MTGRQEQALDALIAGKTDREVASIVGVHRVTVTRWRNANVHFQAALNRRRAELVDAFADRSRTLLLKALDIVEEELDNGNGKTALDVVKVFGRMAHERVGRQDPDEIIDEMIRVRSMRRLQLADPDVRREVLDQVASGTNLDDGVPPTDDDAV